MTGLSVSGFLDEITYVAVRAIEEERCFLNRDVVSGTNDKRARAI
jgi:hypothetical protein